MPVVRAVNNEEPIQLQLSEANVAMPRTMRPRATALLSRLKTRPDVITWDKPDLVSDAMRSRKNFNPEGSKAFFEALTKIGPW